MRLVCEQFRDVDENPLATGEPLLPVVEESNETRIWFGMLYPNPDLAQRQLAATLLVETPAIRVANPVIAGQVRLDQILVIAE